MGTCTATRAIDALPALRDKISDVQENGINALIRMNIAPVDYRGLCFLYSEALAGRRDNSESVFITNAMARVLESCGFSLLSHCGLYFIDWN